MKTGISKILGSISILFLFASTMIHASDEKNFSTMENEAPVIINKSFQTMTTAQLQEEVEKHSIDGDLAFEMGLELIKRWTNS